MKDQKATNVRWTVLGLVAFAAASAYLTRYCVSAANTTIQAELSLNDKQMGWVLAAFGLGYLFFQVPGGLLGDRCGTRFAFAFVSILWSLCNVWSATAVGFISLCASRFGLGAFQAGLTPISARMLKDWIPQKNLGVSSATIGACMSVGGAITLWLTGVLLDEGFAWRNIFYVYSVVGILWAIAFACLVRTSPSEHPGVNSEELAIIRHESPDSRSMAAQSEETRAPSNATPDDSPYALPKTGADGTHHDFSTREKPDAMRMLQSVSMLSLCITAFFRAAGYAFFVTWFFAFLEYVYGVPKQNAGLLASLPLMAVVAGSLVGGFVVDGLLRFTSSKRLSRCGTGLVSLALCAVLTLASAWTSSAIQLSAVMALGAFFSGIASPASWATTIDLGGKHTAVVMGTMNSAGCLAGVILPILLGNWFDTIRNSGGSWDAVIYVHAGFYLVAAVCWLFINPTRSLFERS